MVAKRTRVLSLLIAALAFAVLSGLAIVIFRGMSERNLLESKNDCERTINVLFSSLRNYDSFGAAVEATPVLREKVVGISVFGSTRDLLYTWGKAPVAYPSVEFKGAAQTGQMEEMYIGNSGDNSQVVLVRPLRPPAPPPGAASQERRPPRDVRHENTFTSTIFRQAELLYFEIKQPKYWQDRRLQALLFPLSELVLLFVVGSVWLLFMRNVQYRQEAERQKNLVMLGTAASTLAHEIKNPLLAIRLQTEILSRTLSGEGERELGIIVDEVDRLSQLSTRVNDVLRDPVGNPEDLDPFEVISEIGARLSGRQIVSVPGGAGCTVRIDRERLRSIVENLVRNALESGGPQEGLAVEIRADGERVHIDVLDRGSGLPDGDNETVFDPFFTTKSRGTGIGLAISRRFARAAGGEVELGERPGGGLCARVLLPRVGS